MNGLIAAAISALTKLMSEPTAESNVKKDMYVCPLTRDITKVGYFLYLSAERGSPNMWLSACNNDVEFMYQLVRLFFTFCVTLRWTTDQTNQEGMSAQC